MKLQLLLALMGKDFRLFFANRFFALVTILALVAYIGMFYLLPAQVDERLELGIYMADLSPDLERLFTDEEVRFLRAESREALRQAVAAGDIPVGYALPEGTLAQIGRGERITAELFLSAELPPEFHAIYEVVMNEIVFAMGGQDLAIETREVMLGTDTAGAAVAPRQRLLPMLTLFILMVECLGLASLIASEVAQGTIRALLVTPLTMWGLFVGKGIFGTLFAFTQAAVLMGVTGGLEREPLLILTTLLLGAALVTGVAFLIASVGRDLMSVMGWGTLGLLILVLPAFTILVPGMASAWIRLIPSHYLVDTIYRVVNLNATWVDVVSNLLLLLGTTLFLMALGVIVLRRRFQ
jgi:ABC-2 type transport system permease protein